MNRELEGIESIPGTYPFDVRKSVKALRLNRFFWQMREPRFRDEFVRDEAALMAREGLGDEERALVARRDWLGLVRYGANFFVLEKFARVVGISNLEIYATMRGETFEAFLKTRNVPDAR